MISQFSDSVEDKVDDFLTNGVVTSGVVVGGIFFTSDQLFWVEELSVGTSTDFINNSWFQIDEDGTWDVFASTSFREKGVEGVITTTNGLVRWHLTVWLDTVFQAVKFPTGITLKSALSFIPKGFGPLCTILQNVDYNLTDTTGTSVSEV